MAGRRGSSKALLFKLLALMLVLLVSELSAIVGYLWMRDEVDFGVAWSQSLDETEYQEYLEKYYDEVAGWHSPRGGTLSDETCLGETHTQHYDGLGARIHPGSVAGPVRVVVGGDSFSQGAEVADDETYPAQLGKLLGVRVANHGMGGYGPVQALFALEQVIDAYPDAETVVLGLMHENIKRMATSFWPVFNVSTGTPYAFKPFVRDRAFEPNPNHPPAPSLKELEPLGRSAFDTDFFSRGRWSFPYTLSWIRYLGTDYFQFELRSLFFRATRGSPRGYEAYYESERLRGDLMFVIERFRDWAHTRDLRPIVAFIPRKPGDQRSADRMIDELRARFEDTDLPVVAVGETDALDVDWDAYNLKPGRCHPSPYGYGVIARAVAQQIRLQQVEQ